MNKTLFAQILAEEALTLDENPKAATASFDTDRRVLTLPVWSTDNDNLRDMFIGHEVAHALMTGDTLMDYAHANIKRPGFFSHLNVVEDCRIDRLIKLKFPGLRRDYDLGMRELVERDFFNLADSDLDDLRLIDRINIQFKAGVHYPVKFSDEEAELIARVPKLETEQDVIELAELIYAKSVEQKKQEKQQQSKPQESDESETDTPEPASGDDEESDPTSDSGKSQDQDDNQSDETTDNDSNASDEIDEESDEDESASAPDDSSDLTDADLESKTYEAEKQFQQKLVEQSNKSILTFDYGSPDRQYIFDLKTTERLESNYIQTRQEYFAQYILAHNSMFNEQNKIVAYLVKEFEQRKSAKDIKREYTTKSGRLDTNRLHAVKISEDLFKSFTQITQSDNHAFVFMVDWSVSMNSTGKGKTTTINNTLDNLYILMTFAKRVGIDFDVYYYTSFNSHKESVCAEKMNTIKYSQNESRLVIRHIFSSQMAQQKIKTRYMMFRASSKHCGYGVYFNEDQPDTIGFSMGGTPTHAMLASMRRVLGKFKQNNAGKKLIFVLMTDGASSSIVNRHGAMVKSPVTGRVVDTSNPTSALYKMFRDEFPNWLFVGFFCTNKKPTEYIRGDFGSTKLGDDLTTEISYPGFDKFWIVNFHKEQDLKEKSDKYMSKLEEGATTASMTRALATTFARSGAASALAEKMIRFFA